MRIIKSASKMKVLPRIQITQVIGVCFKIKYMRQIDRDTKEKRSKVYYSRARIKPAYIFLVVPIFVGLAMGIDEFLETKMWGKALVYAMSLGAISSALFFFLRLVLRDISLVYPGKILFCDRLKPTTAMLYAGDDEFTEENKAAIRKKIKSKKGIDLQSIKHKTYKNKKYVKRVDEAVNWLLDVTRFDDILFDYNCIYGFYRNLTAAIFLDGIVLFALAAISSWGMSLPLGRYFWGGGIISVVVSFITTWFAYTNGRRYAKRLYNVFMNLDDDKNNY